MENTAHDSKKPHVLITNVYSYLGEELAKSFLSQNCAVYGIGKNHLSPDLLSKRDFTLLEIDMSQPLPSHLPKFDIVFHFVSENVSFQNNFLQNKTYLSPASSNIISLAKDGLSKVFLVVPISQSIEYYESFLRDKGDDSFLQVLFIGDIYGPNLPQKEQTGQNPQDQKLNFENELQALILQATAGDKIILEREGLKEIYPTYISDAVFAINKFVFSHSSKNIHFIVSEGPKNELSVAYEIQNILRLVSQKEVGLFFTGFSQIQKEPQTSIKISDLGYSPKVTLQEGLKETFEYFRTKGYIHDIETIEVSKEEESQKAPSFSRLRENPKPFQNYELQPHKKQRHITSPFPKFPLRPKIKLLVLAVVLLIVLAIAKSALDIYLGTRNVKIAKSALLAGDFQKASSKALSSSASFEAAQNKIKILLYPFSFVLPGKVKSINFLLESATKSGSSLSYFTQGTEILAKDFFSISSKDSQSSGLDLENPQADFKRSYVLSSQALELIRQASSIGVFVSQINQVKNYLLDLNQFASSATELASLTNDLIDPTGQKTYLILLQNNTELRPGGGFIGNFGLVKFENGKLKDIKVEDIYTIDGQLKEKIEPPSQLKDKLGIDRLYLRDSNWTTDFQVNAATARDFYHKETGETVDGVFAIDLTFLQNLLSKMGPVKLEDYKEEITAQNLFEKGEYYSEIGFFPGSTQKTDFFGALSRTLITKIINSLSGQKTSASQAPWLALIETTKESLSQKHLLFAFDNPTLATFVKSKGYDNALPPSNFNPADDSTETRDFLALSEANIGANKVNRFLERKIDYEMTIGRDADLLANLKITYTNKSQAKTWPGGTYVNFLRVNVPPEADLIQYKNGQKEDTKNVQVSNQSNLTTFSALVEVAPKETRTISFSYKIPKNIQLEKAPFYHFYIQKQPGTDKDPLTFTFHLPGYLQIQSVNDSEKDQGKQNLTVQTDLSTDRQFEIELVKK